VDDWKSLLLIRSRRRSPSPIFLFNEFNGFDRFNSFFPLSLSFHSLSVYESGDENGGRLEISTTNPFSSPFSFTDFPF